MDSLPKTSAYQSTVQQSEDRAWADRADELAAWTEANLVNRSDVWGLYKRRTSPQGEPLRVMTAPRKADRGKLSLDTRTIRRHFADPRDGTILGLHSADKEQMGRWFAIDIDRHDDDDPTPAATYESAALHYYDKLRNKGFRPLLEDSNGAGRFHLWCLLDERRTLWDIYHFLFGLTKDYEEAGLDKLPEVFPKQPTLDPGRFGNWLRLPGRHHTRDHWSRFWDGERWLAGAEAVEHLLAARPSQASLVPAGPKQTPAVNGKAKRVTATTDGPAAGGGGKSISLDEYPMRQRVDRAEAYLFKMASPVEGQRGDDRLFEAACTIYRFGVDDPGQAWRLLSEFNSFGKPPFPDDRVRYKLDEARRKVEAEGQFGVKLLEQRERPAAPAQPTQHGGEGRKGGNGSAAAGGDSAAAQGEDATDDAIQLGGGIGLRPIDASRTPKKITATFAVVVDGVEIEGAELQGSTADTAKRKLKPDLLELSRVFGFDVPTDHDDEITRNLLALFTRKRLDKIAREYERAQAKPAAAEQANESRPSMYDIALPWMRERLDLRFRCEDGPRTKLWSERLGKAISSSEFTAWTSPALLSVLAKACDYAGPTEADPTKPIKQLGQVLKPVWTQLVDELPREANADTGPDSKAAARFRAGIQELLQKPETWMKTPATKDDPEQSRRESLASRTLELCRTYGDSQALQWRRVLSGVNVFWRIDEDHLPWLGLRADACHNKIKGVTVEGVETQADLTRLATRYGLTAGEDGPSAIVRDQAGRRSRVVVLSREFTDFVLHGLEDVEDADEGTPQADDRGETSGGSKPAVRAAGGDARTALSEDLHIDEVTGEVRD